MTMAIIAESEVAANVLQIPTIHCVMLTTLSRLMNTVCEVQFVMSDVEYTRLTSTSWTNTKTKSHPHNSDHDAKASVKYRIRSCDVLFQSRVKTAGLQLLNTTRNLLRRYLYLHVLYYRSIRDR